MTNGEGLSSPNSHLFFLLLALHRNLWYNKEKIIALGTYPSISLKDAREIRDEYKSLIAKGIDPNEQKKQSKEEINISEKKKENTFYKVSQEWLENYKSEVTEKDISCKWK